MMRNYILQFSLIFIFLLVVNYKAQENPMISVKIETDNIEGVLNLKAIVKNDSEVYQSLNYIFLALKKDKKKNTSSSQQQNKFTLLPKETKILSEISVNIQKDDALKVYLFIKDEKTAKLITKDSLELNTKNFQDNISYEKTSNEENMMMKNLVINETKTRVGDDFYSKFYSFLMLNSLQFTFRIRISELPSMGKNSQLQIFADDENILSFNARPEDDYLDDAVKQTINSLINYDNNRKVSDKGLKY